MFDGFGAHDCFGLCVKSEFLWEFWFGVCFNLSVFVVVLVHGIGNC